MVDTRNPGRAYNPGPDMPLASDTAAQMRAKLTAGAKVYARETGLRHKVRAIISNLEHYQTARCDLEARLVGVFSGFTCYPVKGGWRDPETGDQMIEPGLCYEVSFASDERFGGHSAARDMFEHAGRDIGEKWVHIEVSSFYAHHAQVNE